MAVGGVFYGTGDSEIVYGTPHDDLFIPSGGPGSDGFDGGDGLDRLDVPFRADAFFVTVDEDADVTLMSSTVTNWVAMGRVERIDFTDGTLAVSPEALQAYRLYQAAFDRVPDQSGITYWVEEVDTGTSLITAAENFIASPEFQGLYGADPSNEQFIDLLYANVLNRGADQSGYDFWNAQMAGGLSRAEVLFQFSESPENKALTADATEHGVWIA